MLFTRRQLQAWEDCAQKPWQANSPKERNLLYKNALTVWLHCEIMICYLKRSFVLPRADAEIKKSRLKNPRSGSWQRYLFKKYFPKCVSLIEVRLQVVDF